MKIWKKIQNWIYKRWFTPPEEHRWFIIERSWFPVRVEEFRDPKSNELRSVMVVIRTNRIYSDIQEGGTYKLGNSQESGWHQHTSEVLIPLVVAEERFGKRFISFLREESSKNKIGN
jgi:hypothetical protein